jgi:hypothetical protein
MDRLPQHASSRPWLRFRFNSATAMCVITAIAIVCALANWMHCIPYQTVLPSILVATSWCLFSQRKSADLAWSLWSAAWLIAALHFLFLAFDQFNVLGYATSHDRSGLFMLGYVSIDMLPAFLSVPAITVAIRKNTEPRTKSRKYIVAIGVLAIIDMTLSVLVLELLFQYDFPLV